MAASQASSLLERPPWRSDGSGAHYSPYSQYLQVGRNDLYPWLKRPDGASTPEVSELQSILHHELAHWVQSHGTSIGALLSAWRGLQWNCFLEMPACLGAQCIAAILKRRFSARNQPAIRVRAAGLGRDPLTTSQPAFAAWRLQWWGLQLAQRTLESPAGVLAVRGDIATPWSRALLMACGTPADAVRQVPKATRHDGKAMRDVLRSPLGTQDLIEGFASVNQLVYYVLAKQVDRGEWLQRNIDTTVASLSETTYGKALRRYIELFPQARQDLHRNLANFCLVVDLAMNPCLEDARDHCLAGADVNAVFEETYPPTRFERLCAALGDQDLIRLDADGAQIRDAQRRLLKRAGLKAAETIALRAPLDQAPHALEYKSDVLARYSLADVESFWQRQAFEVRKLQPGLFVLPPAQYLLGREWVRDLLRNDWSRPVLLPPMMTDSQRHVYFGLGHGASHCLLFWSIAANAAHSLLVDSGEIALPHFPAEALASGIAEDAVGSVFRHLGIRTDAMRFIDTKANETGGKAKPSPKG